VLSWPSDMAADSMLDASEIDRKGCVEKLRSVTECDKDEGWDWRMVRTRVLGGEPRSISPNVSGKRCGADWGIEWHQL
jgi:hypothetical protein